MNSKSKILYVLFQAQLLGLGVLMFGACGREERGAGASALSQESNILVGMRTYIAAIDPAGGVFTLGDWTHYRLRPPGLGSPMGPIMMGSSLLALINKSCWIDDFAIGGSLLIVELDDGRTISFPVMRL